MNKVYVLISLLSLCFMTAIPIELCRRVALTRAEESECKFIEDEAIDIALGESCYFTFEQDMWIIDFDVENPDIIETQRIDDGTFILRRIAPGSTVIRHKHARKHPPSGSIRYGTLIVDRS